MSEKSSDEERTEAVRALEAQFSDLIGQFRRVISENAHRVSPGLLPGAYKVFTTIARHETVTQATLADHLLLDKGQLSRTVRELEALGLITRSPDPADGRSSLLSPTEYGLERLAAARAPQEGVLVRALESWDVSDIDNLRRLLQALMAGINPDTVS
ncbi:DNA-binding MarR family transcriptional regulator [Microbacterium sp. SORGH_AS428]|uniref:MarR family winged helix-turn-helix transcriptional regulator n=1 Tax=Microbacterium sp. SORGH_AS_0428 TaxID=3041788 RepID=UPI00285CED67|nr:MarR family winged helix-turn-helix transcriptional regulator [Microbacterium sp. SORGH_AS_0428]MDR6200638.1 DNA-binding MarR family transcriptional regulator [Microbacterium sp. SORGH_AS_0428]